MNYAQIRKMDVSNSPGIGVSIFTSGCNLHCPGCHNKQLWDEQYGTTFTNDTIQTIIELMNPSYIASLSILGGEPLLLDNIPDLINLVDEVKSNYPDKKIWLYTGYTLNALGFLIINLNALGEKDMACKLEYLLYHIDYLVDGSFVQEDKDITLAFRGSKNQRIYQNIDGRFVDKTDYFDNQIN